MNISFEGIGQAAATFAAEDGVKPGMAVTLTDSGAVGLGADGDLPCGVALSVEEDGAAAVQISGLARVCYSGSAAPAVGYAMLACDGEGGVKTVTTGGLTCLVAAVDSGSQTAVIKL